MYIADRFLFFYLISRATKNILYNYQTLKLVTPINHHSSSYNSPNNSLTCYQKTFSLKDESQHDCLVRAKNLRTRSSLFSCSLLFLRSGNHHLALTLASVRINQNMRFTKQIDLRFSSSFIQIFKIKKTSSSEQFIILLICCHHVAALLIHIQMFQRTFIETSYSSKVQRRKLPKKMKVNRIHSSHKFDAENITHMYNLPKL